MNPAAQQRHFLKSLDALLTQVGAALAVANDDEPTYLFPTWYGVLRIQPCVANAAPVICSRFLTPQWVREIAGSFDPDNGKWDHDYWTDWNSDFQPGLKLFAARLSKVALSHTEVSSTEKPFRRADGSVVRFCKRPANVDTVEITTTSGELWIQSLNRFHEGARPRLRTVPPHEFGVATARLEEELQRAEDAQAARLARRLVKSKRKS